MSFTKLHSSLVNSSLWCEDDHIRLLFVTLLALADQEGVVYGSRKGLEHAANIKWRDRGLKDPWDVLMSPDEDSSDKMRSPEHEGRRVEEIPGGFRLLNHKYYRGLRDDNERREYMRKLMADKRERERSLLAGVSTVSTCKPQLAQAEAEAEADIHTSSTEVEGDSDGLPSEDNTGQQRKRRKPPKHEYKADFLEFYSAYPRHVGKEGAARKFEVAVKRVMGEHKCSRREAAEYLTKCAADFAEATKLKDKQYIAHPETWLNKGRYDDEE